MKKILNKILPYNQYELQMFSYIELVLGVTLLFYYQSYSYKFIIMLNQLMPQHFWCILLIGGSIFGLLSRNRIWYLLSTSLPLLLYSSVLARSLLESTGASPHSFLVYFLLGISSIYFSAKEFKTWI